MGLVSAAHELHLIDEKVRDVCTRKVRGAVYQDITCLLKGKLRRLGTHQEGVSRDVRARNIKCSLSRVDAVGRKAAKVAADLRLREIHFTARFEAVREVYITCDCAK